MVEVSIITPTYNSEKFIEETIHAIQKQTFKNWELLITDDCSNDDTVEKIEKILVKDERIKLFHLKQNSGSGIARNNSIDKAVGRFIAFCDSDDFWYENKLAEQIEYIRANDLAFTYSSYDVCNVEGEKIHTVIVPPYITYFSTLINNYIGCLTVVYDTHKIGKVFMPEIKKRQDWATWLYILKKIKKTKGIMKPLAVYRKRDDSLSSAKFKLIKYNFNIYNKIMNYNFLSSLALIIIFLINYTVKRIKELK
jgi:glycosyltransferase involved in cell wall biosynthesis